MNTQAQLGQPEKLAALKRSLERAGLDMRTRGVASLGHGEADTVLKGGLRRGALHEVYAHDAHGAAATGFAAALATRLAPAKRLLWIRQDYSALEHGEMYASGLLALGLDPSRVFLMRAADPTDALRAGLDALTCSHLGAVIFEIPGAPKILDLAASRRIVLAAESHGVSAISLRLSAQPSPSACETRWCISAAPSDDNDDWGAPVFDAELQRNRHGVTGSWVMEWKDGVFTSTGRKADPLRLAPAAFDRPHKAKEGLRRSA
jgi:protein ImuA